MAAVAANFTTGVPLLGALTIALGNCLEALSGLYLLQLAGFHRSLDRVRDIILLVVLAAGFSTMVGATFGTGSLAYSQAIPWNQFGSTWLTWWMGNAMGVLVFAPLLLSWWSSQHKMLTTSRLFELILLFVSLVLVTQFVFGSQLFLAETPMPLAFMTFPILIWAAMRFGMRGATTAVLVTGGVVLTNIIYERGLFAQGSAIESLMLLWLYTNFLAVTSIALAASENERRVAQRTLLHLSQHDPLTGLRNRFSLQEDITGWIARAERHEYQSAVLFVDLDGFKTINDTLGHSRGDQLLVAVGQRLRNRVREVDEVYRQGGDEFVILLEPV